MDTTFISIHDLTDDAIILYSSESVVDILGYRPDEIVNHSAWEFFSLEDLPQAREFHRKRVVSDKAAVLVYCRIKDSEGKWVGCECCFTIVYDVMVVCTSIYKRNLKSERRAIEAPIVRRMFSSSPQDPRYHMLSHLSAKFSLPAQVDEHEPRAALFLNRFTRTLTIMYATSGLQDVIGIPAEAMRGVSFYYCIAENCLKDAIKCLEEAKGNDSIAYLRFMFRDPRPKNESSPSDSDDSDEDMATDTSEEGGVGLQSEHTSPGDDMEIDSDESKAQSGHSSGDSTRGADTHEGIFGQSLRAESSTSSIAITPEPEQTPFQPSEDKRIELEAVISCTSDGLVVCLRKARPLIPLSAPRLSRPEYEGGVFAAPWASNPILPPPKARSGTEYDTNSSSTQGPQGVQSSTATATATATATPSNRGLGPDQNDFMNAIRDQAIFAWALTGINGSLARFGQGKPRGESLPREGLPIWAQNHRQPEHGDSELGNDRGSAGYNSDTEMFGRNLPDGKHSANMFGDPGLDRNGQGGSLGSGSAGSSTGNTPFSGSRPS